MPNTRKLDPRLQELICNYIRGGNYVETAVAAAGISKFTFYEWLRRGAREKQRMAQAGMTEPEPAEAAFVEFSDAVEQALATAEARDVLVIDRAAQTGIWQAAAWRLERKFPKRWGATSRIEHSGPGGGPIPVASVPPDLSKLSDEEEELDELERLMARTQLDEEPPGQLQSAPGEFVRSELERE